MFNNIMKKSINNLKISIIINSINLEIIFK